MKTDLYTVDMAETPIVTIIHSSFFFWKWCVISKMIFFISKATLTGKLIDIVFFTCVSIDGPPLLLWWQSLHSAHGMGPPQEGLTVVIKEGFKIMFDNVIIH